VYTDASGSSVCSNSNQHKSRSAYSTYLSFTKPHLTKEMKGTIPSEHPPPLDDRPCPRARHEEHRQRLVVHPSLLLPEKQAQRGSWRQVHRSCRHGRRELMRDSSAWAAADVGGAVEERPSMVIILCNTNNLNNHEFYGCATTFFHMLPMILTDKSK
jgi:hypothetical protein